MNDRQLARARFYYRARALGATLAIMAIVVINGDGSDGALVNVAALMFFGGLITWVVAVVEISEIYGLHASLMPPPREVLHFRPSKTPDGKPLPHAPSTVADVTKEAPHFHRASPTFGPILARCHGDIEVALDNLESSAYGASILRGSFSEYQATLSLTSHHPPRSTFELWVEGAQVATVHDVKLSPYAEIMHQHNVHLSIDLYAGDGLMIATLADPAATEVSAIEARN